MPEMDGITASRIIKTELIPSPFIIACTADLQSATRQECLRSGIDGYLEKVCIHLIKVVHTDANCTVSFLDYTSQLN